MYIEDGKGKGYLANVTDENKLRVYSTVESELSFESETNERTYTWSNVSYNYTAGDTVLLLKNTDNSKNLIIDGIQLSGDTETKVVLHCPECTTPTGTAVTGVNWNRTSSLTADANSKANESTNTQANIIGIFRIDGNNSSFVPMDGGLVLGLNDCIAIDFMTDGGEANVSVRGYYHTKK